VFLVYSGVRQLLSRTTETKTAREEAKRQEAKARNKKQRDCRHCRLALREKA